MGKSTDAPERFGLSDQGHKWLTAIAALIAALGGAGLVGRCSAPDAQPSTTPTVTVTVPAVQGGPPTASDQPSSPGPAAEPAPPLYSSGSVYIDYPLDDGVDMDNQSWGARPGGVSGSGLAITLQVVAGNGGSQLSPIPSGVTASYALCRGQPFVRSSYRWEELPSGSAACIRTKDGRVGWFSVDYVRDRDDVLHELTVSGEVWQPTA